VRLFDLHCDTLGVATDRGLSIEQNDASVDIRRGGTYENWTQVFAAWLPDGCSVLESRSRCERLLTTAHRFAMESEAFRLVTTEEDLRDVTSACRAVLAVENGGATAADDAYLHHLHRCGVRMITMTWNGDNPWGSGCLGSRDGLTARGQQAVRDMESAGILVDVSHMNDTGFWQVAHMSRRSFIVGHTASRAVHTHPRNLTDDQFAAVRDSGGLVGLTLFGDHLGGWDVTAFQRHLEHFLSLGGEHTVCVGADLDGMDCPRFWNGIAIMKEIRQHLAGEGYPPTLLDAVFYQNAFHFFEITLPKE